MEVINNNEDQIQQPIIINGMMPFEIKISEVQQPQGEAGEMAKSFEYGMGISAATQMIAVHQTMGMIQKIIDAETKLRADTIKQKGTKLMRQARFTNTQFTTMKKILPLLNSWKDELIIVLHERAKEEYPQGGTIEDKPVMQ